MTEAKNKEKRSKDEILRAATETEKGESSDSSVPSGQRDSLTSKTTARSSSSSPPRAGCGSDRSRSRSHDSFVLKKKLHKSRSRSKNSPIFSSTSEGDDSNPAEGGRGVGVIADDGALGGGLHYLVIRCKNANHTNIHHLQAILEGYGDYYGQEGMDTRGN